MADVIVVAETAQPQITVVQEVSQSQTVLVTEGGRTGPQGPAGKAGITVSSTAPSNPAINDLWLQI